MSMDVSSSNGFILLRLRAALLLRRNVPHDEFNFFPFSFFGRCLFTKNTHIGVRCEAFLVLIQNGWNDDIDIEVVGLGSMKPNSIYLYFIHRIHYEHKFYALSCVARASFLLLSYLGDLIKGDDLLHNSPPYLTVLSHRRPSRDLTSFQMCLQIVDSPPP